MRTKWTIAPVPYVLEEGQRDHTSLELAEAAARRRSASDGSQMNVVEIGEGGRVVVAVTRRDAEGRVWTDLEVGAALLLI